MADLSKKPFIASILFLDVVGYSKHSVEHQHDIKEHFNSLLSEVIRAIPNEDRIAIDTGDGAAICFLAHPEVALQVALIVRDKLAENTVQEPVDYQVCMGINIGPVRLVKDINQQRNVIGDGINAAQRVISFADPGQILVSSAFHDIVAFLTTDHMNMFQSIGTRPDKHGRNHNVFAVVDDYDTSNLLEIESSGEASEPPPGIPTVPGKDADLPFPDGANSGSRRNIETRFAQYVGPIAKVMVQRGMRQAASHEELCNLLVDLIVEDKDKIEFREYFFQEMPGAEPLTSEEITTAADSADTSLSQAISSHHLRAIEEMLTQHIGPIAGVVIKRHASCSSSIQSLCDNLAQHIESEEQQQRFIDQARSLIDS
jgi:class 3 adenylate cyclase